MQFYDDRDDKDDGNDDDVDDKQANLHRPTKTQNDELTLHKQLIKWRKSLVCIPYWKRKMVNGGKTFDI